MVFDDQKNFQTATAVMPRNEAPQRFVFYWKLQSLRFLACHQLFAVI